jgi:hypothetical protein
VDTGEDAAAGQFLAILHLGPEILGVLTVEERYAPRACGRGPP